MSDVLASAAKGIPQIMGILNVTPDSFSDGGGLYSGGKLSLTKVVESAEAMLTEGADIIDVGGESTRPNADPVTTEEEMRRVIPVVKALVEELGAYVSVDTSTPEVMTAAASVGASMLNDVRALQRVGAQTAALATGLPVCIMHMKGQPKTMQSDPCYQNVVDDVCDFLFGRKEELVALGFDSDKILIDPGFGFGKTPEHNLQLLKHLQRLHDIGSPVLVGLSRKSIFGHVLGREVHQRLAGSLCAAVLAAQKGAQILRVHDVAETRDALCFMSEVMNA